MIRILLVDDQAIVREGMRSMLSLEPDISVVGEAETGLEALSKASALRPDIILLDIRMPSMDGLTALGQLKQEVPRASVIMVTLYDDPNYLERAVTMGAAGYILKDASRDELIRAVRVTAEGGAIIDPLLLPQLLRRLRATAPGAPAGASLQPPVPEPDPSEQATALTEREIEVLRLVAEGLTNQQIGEQLFISPTTVKTHVQNILQKLGVSDRTQAAVHALRARLI
ncbi:MAG: response regulator transcription factor [Anaerolineae bacterium]|nr:response regulator transcription factor [Anaerolineae bacterium]